MIEFALGLWRRGGRRGRGCGRGATRHHRSCVKRVRRDGVGRCIRRRNRRSTWRWRRRRPGGSPRQRRCSVRRGCTRSERSRSSRSGRCRCSRRRSTACRSRAAGQGRQRKGGCRAASGRRRRRRRRHVAWRRDSVPCGWWIVRKSGIHGGIQRDAVRPGRDPRDTHGHERAYRHQETGRRDHARHTSPRPVDHHGRVVDGGLPHCHLGRRVGT